MSRGCGQHSCIQLSSTLVLKTRNCLKRLKTRGICWSLRGRQSIKLLCFLCYLNMCILFVPVRISSVRYYRPRTRSHHYHNLSSVIYPTRSTHTQHLVTGGLWNCQSATRETDLISGFASKKSLDFLALTVIHPHVKPLCGLHQRRFSAQRQRASQRSFRRQVYFFRSPRAYRAMKHTSNLF